MSEVADKATVCLVPSGDVAAAPDRRRHTAFNQLGHRPDDQTIECKRVGKGGNRGDGFTNPGNRYDGITDGDLKVSIWVSTRSWRFCRVGWRAG